MSKTDWILAAVAKELAGRRQVIDDDPGLRTVTVTVMLNKGTGEPLRVIFRPDSEKLLTKAATAG